MYIRVLVLVVDNANGLLIYISWPRLKNTIWGLGAFSPSLSFTGQQVHGFHWSKYQHRQTIITEDVVICVRARYTLCHDMCHVCMMDSISNLLLIVDY